MQSFLDKFQNEIEKDINSNVFFIAEYSDGEVTSRALANTNPCQNIYSIAKLYMVTAIGILFDRSLVNLDDKLVDILKDELPAHYNKVWDSITLDMLLSHKLPLCEGFLDIDSLDATSFGEDYLSYVLNAPLRNNYDLEKSTYTDAAFYLVSRIIEKISGVCCDTFLWKNLLYPTKCREAAFSKCPMGHCIGATGIYIRAEELAKLGSIYVNDGMFEDKRILSSDFVKIVFQRSYELHPIKNGFAFGKGGMRGQMLMIIPSRKKSIAWLGCGNNNLIDFVLREHNCQ